MTFNLPPHPEKHPKDNHTEPGLLLKIKLISVLDTQQNLIIPDF